MASENQNEEIHKIIDLTGLAIYDEAIKEWFLNQFEYAEIQDILDLFDSQEESE